MPWSSRGGTVVLTVVENVVGACFYKFSGFAVVEPWFYRGRAGVGPVFGFR